MIGEIGHFAVWVALAVAGVQTCFGLVGGHRADASLMKVATNAANAQMLLIVLARRLPPGVAKDLAAFLPDCVTTMRTLRRDPRVPRRAKVALLVAVLWVLSPIDLIPEFLPVIGPLDDIIAVALLLRYAGRTVPRQVEIARKGDAIAVGEGHLLVLDPVALREHLVPGLCPLGEGRRAAQPPQRLWPKR